MYFPKGTTWIKPEGGMFLWVSLPKGYKVNTYINKATLNKVAFVPGSCFYINPSSDHTLRLNFSNTNLESIEEGIKRLGRIFEC